MNPTGKIVTGASGAPVTITATTEDIPVVYQGPDDALARAFPPVTHVWVSSSHMQSERGGLGEGKQVYGVCVRAKVGAEAPHPGEIWGQMIRGTSRWEPTTINLIGGLGAYRDVPPADKHIAAAINEGRRRIGNYLRKMTRLKRDTPGQEEAEHDSSGAPRWNNVVIPAGTPYFRASQHNDWDPQSQSEYARIETPGYHTYLVRPGDLH